MPPQQRDMLAHAQEQYIGGDYNGAVETLSTLVKAAPKLAEVYHLLGLIHEESGNMVEAFQFYSIACVHEKRNLDLLKKTTEFAFALGIYDKVRAVRSHFLLPNACS